MYRCGETDEAFAVDFSSFKGSWSSMAAVSFATVQSEDGQLAPEASTEHRGPPCVVRIDVKISLKACAIRIILETGPAPSVVLEDRHDSVDSYIDAMAQADRDSRFIPARVSSDPRKANRFDKGVDEFVIVPSNARNACIDVAVASKASGSYER